MVHLMKLRSDLRWASRTPIKGLDKLGSLWQKPRVMQNPRQISIGR